MIYYNYYNHNVSKHLSIFTVLERCRLRRLHGEKQVPSVLPNIPWWSEGDNSCYIETQPGERV